MMTVMNSTGKKESSLTKKESTVPHACGPMGWIPLPLRGRTFIVLATLTVILLGVQTVLDRALAPHGIVALELAGTPERAAMVMMGWGNEGMVVAAFGLGLDYLFALAYAATLAMACQALAGRSSGAIWRRLGIWLAWGSLAAGALDMLENTAIARMLLTGQLAPWATVSAACAVAKFLLVGLALLYVIAGIVLLPLRR